MDEDIFQFMEKAKNSTCKIINEEGYGSGFFCKIPYKEDGTSYLNALLTCEHVLKKEIVSSNDRDIKIIINNEEKIITLKKTRKKWYNENLDYSCIEIKEEDNIDNDYYQLDDVIFEKDYNNEIFLKENYNNIIVFATMVGQKRGHDSGNISDIGNGYFIHDCNTYSGCSGGVIVNKKKNSVIGMHRGTIKKGRKKITNAGTFIKDIIDNIISNPIIENIGDEIEDKREMNIIDEINIKYVYKENIDFFGYKYSYIRLFGKKFVENNKDFCKIIINGNENDLVEFYDFENKKLENKILENEHLEKEILEKIILENKKNKRKNRGLPRKKLKKRSLTIIELDIKLKGIINITKMNHMFCGCEHLSSVSDISNWNTKKVIDMSNLFCKCITLKSLPDISKWKTRNVTNMSKLFCQCKLLCELPDISKWNTENVTNMEKMFCGCNSLRKLQMQELS